MARPCATANDYCEGFPTNASTRFRAVSWRRSSSPRQLSVSFGHEKEDLTRSITSRGGAYDAVSSHGPVMANPTLTERRSNSANGPPHGVIPEIEGTSYKSSTR